MAFQVPNVLDLMAFSAAKFAHLQAGSTPRPVGCTSPVMSELQTVWLAACTTCDRAVQTAIFDDGFPLRLASIVLPLAIGGLAVGSAAYLVTRRYEQKIGPQAKLRAYPVVGAGVFLGIGLGGFLDGIVLHQLLQVHQMISNIVPPELSVTHKNVNMFWDGIFHLGTWTFTAIGVGALWRSAGRADVRYSTVVLLSAALLGWGAFNILDSVANHSVFEFHNVVERSAYQGAWNLGFLIFGIAQVGLGWALLRRDLRRAGSLRQERGA